MSPAAHRRERRVGLAILLLLAALPILPPIGQDQAYHDFADTRTILGLPNALDTLSNLAFLIGGGAGIGLVLARRLPGPATALGAMTLLTFIGFVATALGSAWYHVQVPPTDAGLAIDRYGMVIAFAGILGLAAAHRASDRAGWAVGAAALVAGPLAVWWWGVSGSLTPYALLQFGGMAVIVLLVAWRDGTADTPVQPGPNWPLLIGFYLVAKVLEMGDHEIWQWTANFVSGHTLKHLAAAMAAPAIIIPMLTARAHH